MTVNSKKTAIKFMIWLASVVIALLVCHSPWAKLLENLSSDFMYRIRGAVKAPDEIVIIAIDEPSFAFFDMQWPWPRSIHAKLVSSLFEKGAKTVALDIIFSEPSNLKDDLELKNVIARNPEIILASNIQTINESGYVQQIITKPHPSIADEKSISGLANLPVDSDGFIRSPAFSGAIMNSFALEAAKSFCRQTGCEIEPDINKNQSAKDVEINFTGPPGSIRTVSYYQALYSDKYLPAGFFRNRLVFVGLVTGVTTDGRDKGHDNFPVPFSRWEKGYMSGVEIHAQAASSIIKKTLIRKCSGREAAISGITAGIVSGGFFLFTKPFPAVFALAAGLVSSAGIVLIFFTEKSARLPLTFLAAPQIVCYLSASFIHYREVWKEKNFIREAFSRYLSPAVVSGLIKNPERLKPGGETVEATVMFLDFADFTSLSEKTRPEELINILNQYLERFTEIIFKWDGMVDKFIGDAVMAVWGTPVKVDDHALRACHAALEIKKAVEEMTAKDPEKKIKIRIGINTGSMIAGNVGGSRYFNYTVLGDEVNIASRLEGVNRIYGTTVIIGPKTAKYTENLLHSRKLDNVRVKGKKTSLVIHELVDVNKPDFENTALYLKYFEDGRIFYEKREWSNAVNAFKKAIESNPADMASMTYIRRCMNFVEKPPGIDWDGAVSLEK